MVGSIVVSRNYLCQLLFLFVSKNCTGESDVTTSSIAAPAAAAAVMVKLPLSPPNLHVLCDEYEVGCLNKGPGELSMPTRKKESGNYHIEPPNPSSMQFNSMIDITLTFCLAKNKEKLSDGPNDEYSLFLVHHHEFCHFRLATSAQLLQHLCLQPIY